MRAAMALAAASPSPWRALLLLLASAALLTPSSTSSPSLACWGAAAGFCPFDLSAAPPAAASAQPLAQAHPRHTGHEAQPSQWPSREVPLAVLAVGHYPPKKLDALRLSALFMPSDQVRRTTGSFRIPALMPRRRRQAQRSCQGAEATSAPHDSESHPACGLPMSCASGLEASHPTS